MVLQEKPSFEALVYTTDRMVAANCARAFADLPIDWSLLDEPGRVAECVASGRYDFLLVDLDSPLGTTLLTVAGDDRHNMVLFGITQGGVDAEILEMSYESLIFYPVRSMELVAQLHRAMPLAERMTAERQARTAPKLVEREVLEPAARQGTMRLPVPRGWTALARNLVARFKNLDLRHPSRYLLSIVWQERVASSIAAFGTIWYIHEVTQDLDWSKLAFLVPPRGPLELIGLATLLWLAAKHRRVADRIAPRPAAPPVEVESHLP